MVEWDEPRPVAAVWLPYVVMWLNGFGLQDAGLLVSQAPITQFLAWILCICPCDIISADFKQVPVPAYPGMHQSIRLSPLYHHKTLHINCYPLPHPNKLFLYINVTIINTIRDICEEWECVGPSPICYGYWNFYPHYITYVHLYCLQLLLVTLESLSIGFDSLGS